MDVWRYNPPVIKGYFRWAWKKWARICFESDIGTKGKGIVTTQQLLTGYEMNNVGEHNQPWKKVYLQFTIVGHAFLVFPCYWSLNALYIYIYIVSRVYLLWTNILDVYVIPTAKLPCACLRALGFENQHHYRVFRLSTVERDVEALEPDKYLWKYMNMYTNIASYSSDAHYFPLELYQV